MRATHDYWHGEMEIKEFNASLLQLYQQRDVEGIIASVSAFKSDPQFQPIQQALISKRRLAPSANTLEEITKALILEMEEAIANKPQPDEGDNFFEVAEKLKRHYNQEVAELYLDTWMLNDFILSIRELSGTEEKIPPTERTISTHKQEYIRIKKGLAAVFKEVQPYSNFQ